METSVKMEPVQIPVIEVDCTINEEPFADAVMRIFDEFSASKEVQP